MSNETNSLPSLLAQLSAWRTISNDETLLGAPEEIHRVHLQASEILSHLQEGSRDPWLGGEIECIVRKSTKFIVYLDKALEIRWWWLVRVNEDVVNAVQARVNALEHESSFLLTHKPVRLVPWREAPNVPQRAIAKNIRCLIGEAMANALNSSTLEDCERVLAEAERQIAIVKDQQARPVFTGWFGFWVAMFGILSVSFYSGGKFFVAAEDLGFVQMWLEAGLCGAFGALISALTRTRALQLEPAAGHRGLAIEAAARAFIGLGAGLLVFFALEAGVLQAALSSDPEVQRGMRLFICVAAGASERILPSLIGKADNIVETRITTTTAASTSAKQGSPPREKPANEQAVG